VLEQNAGGRQRPGDQGGADPMVAAALSAYAAGTGSEYAALTALAGSRLLVPVVAVLSNEPHEADAAGEDAAGEDAAGEDAAGEKVSEMALPTLVGHDGRAAVLAFTCLGSLTRWRPDARPLPVPAQRVWQAGTQEAGAVVIDVAGPVPLAVEGARLAALAGGGRAPLPHEDPDVRAAAEAALAGEPLITGARLAEPADGSDVALQVMLAAGCDAALAGAAVRRAVAGLMTAMGGRFRRGVGVAVVEAGRTPGWP
jgi:SseB protein N-terminal domain